MVELLRMNWDLFPHEKLDTWRLDKGFGYAYVFAWVQFSEGWAIWIGVSDV